MIKNIQFDKIGIISSSLCMIHCIGTPFIFIAKACTTTCCSNAPTWWIMIDYLFLIISFVAIYFTTYEETISWLKISFWTTWIFLLLATLEHSFSLSIFPNYFIYFPASLIIILHFYNLNFNVCKNENCNPTK
ncbi:MAG: hypothetical protein CMP70_03885 [Flavobacteriales bacterium]|nr:hypothetical protein [Flavobacteriales bacterium]